MLDEFGLKTGDTVADIGAASGWIDGILSLYTDSVSYYIQDINTVYLNSDEFEKVNKYYSGLRAGTQTNTFQLVIGVKKQTNLPDIKFDKIIFNNSFHEILFSDKILQDVIKRLKPGGQLIIREGMSNNLKTHKLSGCKISAYKCQQIIDKMRFYGYYLLKVSEPLNSFHNCLVFGANINESYSFYNSLKDSLMEKYLTELDKFSNTKYAVDSFAVENNTKLLQKTLQYILSKYSTLENHFYFLGSQYLAESKYATTQNVLNAGLILYPQSPGLNAGLGELFFKRKIYNTSYNYYKIASDTDPESNYYKSKLIQLQEKLE